jgi:hypothetical protein
LCQRSLGRIVRAIQKDEANTRRRENPGLALIGLLAAWVIVMPAVEFHHRKDREIGSTDYKVRNEARKAIEDGREEAPCSHRSSGRG